MKVGVRGRLYWDLLKFRQWFQEKILYIYIPKFSYQANEQATKN